MQRMFVSLALVAFGVSAQALDFNFTTSGTIDSRARDGFVAAGKMWSSRLSDNITVNIRIGYQSLGTGIIAQTGSSEANYSYSDFKTKLQADRSSTLDNTAFGALDAGNSYGFVINSTTTNNRASHLATSNSVQLSSANAKALGFNPNVASDGSITFSNQLAFDFDPSNGIDSNKLDFVGVAAHEIGHALGFFSGVDVLDANRTGNFNDASFNGSHSSLDLFRYQSFNGVNTRSFTTGNTAKYFSTDGGSTLGPRFATGGSGDGDQASHWKDNLGLGLLDPTASFGELGVISQNDINAMDAIGWNVKAVPEPASMAALGLGVVAMIRRRKKA